MSFRTAAGRYSPPAPVAAVHVHAFGLPTLPVLFGTWSRVPLVHLPVAHGIPLLERADRALERGAQLGRGRPLLDDDRRLVGEYAGTNLYCLFDLLGQEEAWIPALLRRHLDVGLPHLLPALAAERGIPVHEVEDRLRLLRDETEAVVRASRLASRHAAREAYVGACQEGVAEEIQFLETEVAFLEAGVEEMARRSTADTRHLRAGRRGLRLAQGRADSPEADGWEPERLRALPEVCEVHAQNGWIRLTTAPIAVEHAGRRYQLGRFRLDLHASGDVRIVNLTHRIGPYDHPHVHCGRPCLGAIREGIAKLLGECQAAAAAEVLIDFVKTVNPTEWRIPVLNWPEAGDEARHGVLAAT